jgi:hypothetical protein
MRMGEIIMTFIKSTLKTFLCVTIFCLFSCYSSPEKINGLIDYSDVILSKTTIYDIEVNIFNKDLGTLRQNVFNEIIQNDGEIIREEIQNINSYRIIINMPRNNTAEFIRKIKEYGIVVNETMNGNNVKDFFESMEMRLMNIKNMLEKYNELLKDATEISDKLLLEREINNAQMEIESIERNRNEMEFRLKNNTIIILMYNK